MGIKTIDYIYSKLEPNKVIAIVSSNASGKRVNLTDESHILQASFINLSRAERVTPHSHLKFERKIFGTEEIWFILRGKAIAFFYDIDNTLILSVKISKGQILLLFDGGHALQVKSRNFSMIEIKNGPYFGKEYDTIPIS